MIRSKRSALPLIILMLIFSFSLILTGCATTTRTISTDREIHYDEEYDFSDKKQIVDGLVEPLMDRYPAAGRRPVVIVYPVANRTSEHIDTSGITDDIREELLRSGRFRFLNEDQRDNIARELDYQYNSGMVDPGQRIARARQAGADYILSGTLRSIEKEEGRGIKLKKKKMNYYSLHLQLTDLRSGLIDWSHSVDLAREASEPIIGW
jgi:hypothetical protein